MQTSLSFYLSSSPLLEQLWQQMGFASTYQEALFEPLSKFLKKPNPLFQLSRLCCQLLGGAASQCEPVYIAWNVLRYASKILDDIQDGDHPLYTESHLTFPNKLSIDLNVSTGLIFSAYQLLFQLENYDNEAEASQAVRERFSQVLLQMTYGQHADLTLTAPPTLEQAWQISDLNFTQFIALAGWSGGRLVTAVPQTLDHLWQLSWHIGRMVQLADDAKDLWSKPDSKSDLKTNSLSSLGISYAFSVLPPLQAEELKNLLQQIQVEETAEEQARQIILESGAGLYFVVQSKTNALSAQKHLSAISTENPHIAQQINKLIEPLTIHPNKL